MAEIAWTPEAADNFAEIAEYIAGDSALHAEAFAVAGMAQIEKLSLFPEMGRKISGADAAQRELRCKNYTIGYRYHDGIIRIHALIHNSRYR